MTGRLAPPFLKNSRVNPSLKMIRHEGFASGLKKRWGPASPAPNVDPNRPGPGPGSGGPAPEPEPPGRCSPLDRYGGDSMGPHSAPGAPRVLPGDPKAALKPQPPAFLGFFVIHVWTWGKNSEFLFNLFF